MLRDAQFVRIPLYILSTQQLNNIFDTMLSKVAPTSKFTEQGISIFNTGVGKYKSMKRTAGELWDDAYKLHKNLADPIVLNANKLFGSIMDLGQGKTLREFVGMTNEKGNTIIDEMGSKKHIKSKQTQSKIIQWREEESLRSLSDPGPTGHPRCNIILRF